MEFTIIIITVLVAIVIALLVYNIVINKRIKTFKDINQKVTSLNVLQEFMSTVRRHYDSRRENCKN